MEDHQVQASTYQASKFVGYFEKTVNYWIKSLGTISEVVDLLGTVARSWQFLENLFMHSEEVKKELPEESKNFVGIDRNVKEILGKGNELKNILKFCLTDNLMEKLEQVNTDLELCEKALMNFLGTKKNAFPRFFFLSVDDLLDILSNGDKP
jgi:dynein heavy chain